MYGLVFISNQGWRVPLAIHSLSANFAYFFNRLNPSPTFVSRASSEHSTITGLLEDPNGLASELSPVCFLQGSYRQQTAIYTINDVDIVVLCKGLSFGESGGGGGRTWSRNEIFDTLAAPLLNDGRYRNKVRYNEGSMCIKVDLGIKVEILPAVLKRGNHDPRVEPFCLYRPHKGRWEEGYARTHQAYLTSKNSVTNSNYIPAIKVFKHIRNYHDIDAVSFHIESLLHAIPNVYFEGSPADYIASLLGYIAQYPAEAWYRSDIKTPCGERDLFDEDEWNWHDWSVFHQFVVLLARLSRIAATTHDRPTAIECWKDVLGNDFFPREVSR
ncbi:SMODS domain-containing nucleotidyltransferase [Paenibacillus alkalitolerans]|uniref:SMODS domain-containing nucleotidyltransferase n=1 Tax=Paenibacillus alkalitolerans TaxID=2799335 RepID=UPI0018F77F03|nr:hypothetical protein [Paenibacillus alkalitolerans]